MSILPGKKYLVPGTSSIPVSSWWRLVRPGSGSFEALEPESLPVCSILNRATTGQFVSRHQLASEEARLYRAPGFYGAHGVKASVYLAAVHDVENRLTSVFFRLPPGTSISNE